MHFYKDVLYKFHTTSNFTLITSSRFSFLNKKIHKHTSTLALLIVFNLSVIYETLFQLCFSLYTLGIDTLTRLNNEYPVIDLLQLPKSQDNG